MKNKVKNNNTPVQTGSGSGVEFKYSGSKTSGSKAFTAIMGTLMNFVLTMAISLGAMFTFTTMFQIKYHDVLFWVIALVWGLAINIVFQLPKKIVKYTLLGIFGVLIATPLIFLNLTISGFEYIRDFVFVGISKSMLWTVPELSYTFTEAMKLDTTFLLALVAILVITVVTFFTVRKINFFPVFLISFPLFEIGAAFGAVPNHFWFAAMLSGWMGIFAMHSSSFIRKIRKRKKDKKKSKTTAAERKQTLISSIGIIVAVITFVTFSLGNFIVDKAGYSRPEDMKKLRSNFKTYVSDFIDYILGYDNDGSLREGRLYQLGDRNIKNRHYLTVVSPFADQSYLRGYIGGEYLGDSWGLPTMDPNYEWLAESFESSGYYPQNMQGKALENIADRNTFVKQSAATISISNLRRKKDYAYTTYVPLLSNDFNLSGDTAIEPKNKSEYSYTAFANSGNLFVLNTGDLYVEKEFSSIWKEYSKYVKYTYTKVPNGLPEVNSIVDGLVNGTGYGYKGKGVAQSNIAIADRIREYLKANIKYSLTTQKLPEGEDFVSWLLLENKQGYSAHYATAMAVMLRMANVPARYVEGYVITPDDFKNSTKVENGYLSTDVTDSNAHAWIEIYESNYGWIPIEATPGFFEGSLVDDVSVDEENLDSPESNENEEQEYQQNENSDIVIEQEMEEEPPELELKEEETTSSALQIIMNIIKYLFMFIGLTAAIFVIILIFAFIVLVIRRAIRLGLIRRNINSTNRDRKVLAIYNYYISLLKFENLVNTEQLPYLKFAHRVANESTTINAEHHIRMMNIFLKYRFSNQPLTEDEIKYIENTVFEYRKNKIKAISGEEKFEFIFVENLG
ncbi:MAG: transglutaminase domain-containing protein [Ruminococcaceae bacterium]|nr:transglutaminase domain-containing protein [Oscillospiraceae bacterium]